MTDLAVAAPDGREFRLSNSFFGASLAAADPEIAGAVASELGR